MTRDEEGYQSDSGRTITRLYHERDDDFPPAINSEEYDSEEIDLEDQSLESEPQFLRASKRIPVRKGAVTKKTANRLRILVVCAILVCATAALSVAVYHYATTSWRFRIDSSDNIETSGLRNVSRAQILEVLGGDIGRNIFRVSLEDRERQLEAIPWVQSATVMRLLPNRLRIAITERKPVAFVRIRSKIALIDPQGVVMEMPVHSQERYSFPVITGMSDSEPPSTYAARMNIYSALMKELDSGGDHYSKDLSEVELSDPDDVKITVQDPGGALVIHLGSTNYLQRYKIYLRHIQGWRQQFNKLESVDLRFSGQIIINADGRSTNDSSAAAQPVGPGKKVGT